MRGAGGDRDISRLHRERTSGEVLTYLPSLESCYFLLLMAARRMRRAGVH